MNTVKLIADSNLCCSCGICKNVCPKGSISYKREKGMFIPVIADTCINCGKCISTCPSVGHEYNASSIDDAMIGNILAIYNAWSRDPDIRHCSASAGVVTSIVRALLQEGEYDCVFTLDSYDYSEQLKTNRYDKETYKLIESKKQKFTKSRYLPVSHENLTKYIVGNRDARVIIIGTSCAVRGICKVIEKFRLNRSNYLIIGLFCDQVFNYNIYDYFSDSTFTDGKKLTGLHFKNKDSGGWPGNIKLMFDDRSFKYLDKSERTKCKDYFKPERCLYCIDKLNVMADISIGDNYTSQNSTPLGSNSVIVRTEAGRKALDVAKDNIELFDIDIESIKKAQYFDGRQQNYYYSVIKEKKLKRRIRLNPQLQVRDNYKDYYMGYDKNLADIRIGEGFAQGDKLRLPADKSKTGIFKKIKYTILRRL